MMNEDIININEFNKENLKLLKYSNNENFYTIHLECKSYPIKLITDFNNYCYANSVIENIGLEKFNLNISFKKRDILNIIKYLDENIMEGIIVPIILNDPFHIYQKIDKYDKSNIDYSELLKMFLDNIDMKTKNINELLLSPTQIIHLIINEIKKINSNKEYKHFITIDPKNIFSLIINLEFEQKIELRLIIDPYFYPLVPPKIEYIKPKIKFELLFSINNLDILMLKNWSPTINIEYLITNLANQLEPIIKEYIITDLKNNDFEYELIKLSSIVKDSFENKIKFDIPIPKQNKINSSGYWKSGIGYGTSNDIYNGWNIEKYIQEKENEKDRITNILSNINSFINSSTISIIQGSILESYLINQTRGLTMLELEENKKLYRNLFEILSKIIQISISQSFINVITENIKIIGEEICQLVKTNEEFQTNQLFLVIYETTIRYQKQYKETIKEITISQDIKEKYCQIMKTLQFGNYEIPSYHQYIKNNMKLKQSAIMRTLSEISSFKTGLPLNWESTIWVRVSKTNFNIFSFLISGPKDTPYENGLFEFHAYFPVDYPNIAPEVLIHTTDNGKIRFNPNLYANGKVCLSLLGTWSGQESEKWNPKTSTFLQVMISIQSLILVEDPYFNEPGYERDIHTPKGKTNSTKYNQDLHPNTIKLGMINMIKNPPPGFEEVIKNHFSMKKEEIINTIQIWEQNATNHKEVIKNNNQELITLLDTI